jgi:hypothetical protein
MGCNDKLSSTCGKRHNAKCVDYEGDLHGSTELDDCDCHNVESVIEDLNSTVDEIEESIDLSTLGDRCIDYEEVDGKIQVKEALLKIEEVVCELKDQVEDTDNNDCPNIFTQDFSCLNLDFKCLTDPCGDQITNLKGLLQALIDKSCE